jgi:hypothetical protein
MTNKLEKSLVGACGVFHVSAELSYRGWVAMPTIRNTRGIDIIASRNGKSINIQVKTNSHGKAKYPLDVNALASDDLYYVFVTLKSEKERPDFYIIPSKFVVNYIEKTHKYWTTLPPRVKKTVYERTTAREIVEIREKTSVRRFPNYVGAMLPEFRDFQIENHRDKWDFLEK